MTPVESDKLTIFVMIGRSVLKHPFRIAAGIGSSWQDFNNGLHANVLTLSSLTQLNHLTPQNIHHLDEGKNQQ